MKYPDGSYSLSDDFEPISYRQDSRLLIVRGCPDNESYAAVRFSIMSRKGRGSG